MEANQYWELETFKYFLVFQIPPLLRTFFLSVHKDYIKTENWHI